MMVVEIKPSAPDAVAVTQIRGNRFATEGTTFVDVFKYAYNVHPDQVRDQLKAWCTRRLKEFHSAHATRDARMHWWGERGSKRYLNDLNSLEAAILYVKDAQDKPRYER